MPNITHTTSRPSSPKSKVLIVRQPVKSVRKQDEPERLPMRLAIGVIIALGVVATVWLMGYLGYRLGFAPLVRVRDLVGEPGLGLSTGTMMVIVMPRMIFQAGLAQPMWLMIGFAMIAIPAACLGAAKPLTPGGPRPRQPILMMASLGAVAAMVAGAAMIWWTSSPVRSDLLRVLPVDPAKAVTWHEDMQTVAGLDVLAVVAAALWLVLVMRLPIAIWLRAIAVSAACFTLVVVMVAMSISNATAAHVGATRPLCVLDDSSQGQRLVLGSTPQHLATLTVRGGCSIVELCNHEDGITILGRQSIVDYLSACAPPEE